MKKVLAYVAAIISIAAFCVSSSGCKELRLPEEVAADKLERQLDNQLELEERKLLAAARVRVLNKEYALKLANLRNHYQENND